VDAIDDGKKRKEEEGQCIESESEFRCEGEGEQWGDLLMLVVGGVVPMTEVGSHRQEEQLTGDRDGRCKGRRVTAPVSSQQNSVQDSRRNRRSRSSRII
jgi:hypothetical protein